nr:Gal-binding and CUB domains containing protein 3 [Arenicola marina]
MTSEVSAYLPRGVLSRLLVLSALWTVVSPQQAGSLALPQKFGSQCFHVKGVPTLQLRCPRGQLVRVQQAFYGAPPDNTTCRYDSGEGHCLQLTDMTENCMGRYQCTVHVSNPFLMNCRHYANYMQINYTCVPKMEIHDICAGLALTTTHGYLRTPNYPDANYNPGQHCACRLKTSDSSILLQLLDFHVNHTKGGVCESDFLRITGWGKKCGYIAPQRLPETLEINKPEVTLEFHSDAAHETRGFWLEFNGSELGKVTLTCGPVLDPNTMTIGNARSLDQGYPDPRSNGDLEAEIDEVDLADRDNLIRIDDTGANPALWIPPNHAEGSDPDGLMDLKPGDPGFGNPVAMGGYHPGSSGHPQRPPESDPWRPWPRAPLDPIFSNDTPRSGVKDKEGSKDSLHNDVSHKYDGAPYDTNDIDSDYQSGVDEDYHRLCCGTPYPYRYRHHHRPRL